MHPPWLTTTPWRPPANTARFDGLVVTSLRFLTSVVGKKQNESVFSDPTRLQQIVQNVVLPNIAMTENDEDLFDENPVWPEHVAFVPGSFGTHAALLMAARRRSTSVVTWRAPTLTRAAASQLVSSADW